ncbi:MAG: hypothetical protein ABII82_00230 [Verrucomicrobiota bacterium]
MENISNHIPDVWFDLYARFLPGAFAISFIGISNFSSLDSVSPALLTTFLIGSYLVGHIIQPIGSTLAKGIIGCIDCADKREPKYQKLVFTSGFGREHKLVEKAYSEAVGFCSMSYISFIYFIYYQINSQTEAGVLSLAASLILMLLGIIRCTSRASKIDKVLNLSRG